MAGGHPSKLHERTSVATLTGLIEHAGWIGAGRLIGARRLYEDAMKRAKLLVTEINFLRVSEVVEVTKRVWFSRS